MVESELHQLIDKVQRRGCEGQTIEVKSAHKGCPEKLYDTISAFANQDDGGIFLFGLDEKNGFAKVGVYNAQDLQRKVMEYGEKMTPVVKPVFTVCEEDGKVFVSAEIPPVDVTDRPCFLTSRGRVKGSYTRVGEADKPMSEYEVYSYEAFRKKYKDDIRPSEEKSLQALEPTLLNEYLKKKTEGRPHLGRIPLERQYELCSITKDGKLTLAALLLFGIYPQATYPRLCISATCIPGEEKGSAGEGGTRFTDTQLIEGTISDMLEAALSFVRKNMRKATRFDPKTGERIDEYEYPITAVREAVLNALVHRDYSQHTEGMPILLEMYTNRLEITNPGGLYGRLTLDQLGHTQPDTRNPVLATAMEVMGETENRYSGIPTIRHAMEQQALPDPFFEDTHRTFKVILYNKREMNPASDAPSVRVKMTQDKKGLLTFCLVPRSRNEIMNFLQIESGRYALRQYLDPLVETGLIRMTIPDKPRSHHQKFVTVEDIAKGIESIPNDPA